MNIDFNNYETCKISLGIKHVFPDKGSHVQNVYNPLNTAVPTRRIQRLLYKMLQTSRGRKVHIDDSYNRIRVLGQKCLHDAVRAMKMLVYAKLIFGPEDLRVVPVDKV